VALEGDEAVGFGQLDPSDRIALLATAPQHGRKGVATAICRELEKLAASAGQSRLRTEASLIAQPLFIRLGRRRLEGVGGFRWYSRGCECQGVGGQRVEATW
jgi:hypothetical protein